VVLVGPGEAAVVDDAVIEQALSKALEAGSVRDAAATVAERLGVPRRRVYDLAIELNEKKRAGND
jgi:16S rRNA (cytidine1402-2'-O)-methyltransferase